MVARDPEDLAQEWHGHAQIPAEELVADSWWATLWLLCGRPPADQLQGRGAGFAEVVRNECDLRVQLSQRCLAAVMQVLLSTSIALWLASISQLVA